MSPRDGIRLSNEANRAIEAGGLTAAQAQEYINGLDQYLIYTNLAAGFQTTIDRLEAVVRAGGEPVKDPPTSAGSIVANNQTARTDGATAQNPTSLVTEPLGSVEEPIEVDQGLDEPSLGLNISQATPAPDINAGRVNVAALVEGGLSPQEALDVAAGGTASTATQTGVGDGRADSPIVTGNSTKDMIKATFGTATNSRIITQPNILDEYASYTYQISWYLMTAVQFNQLINSPQRSVAGWTLLIQSGGAPKTTDNNTSSSSSPGGRSAMFPVDYYIDDLEITSSTPGGGTQMAHCATDIKFKVTEPNGITLIQNLYRANKEINTPGGTFIDPTVPDYASQDRRADASGSNLTPNYIKAQYCLVVRFYGYDSQGNLSAPIVGRYNRQGTGRVTTTDPRAIVEKIYPFTLNQITFRVTKAQVEYNIEAKPVAQNVAIGQNRGTIPFPFQLSGTTVKDLLRGNAPLSQLPPLAGERTPQATPSSSNIPPGPPNPRSTSAGVDALGNFTGESDSPTQVGA
jgi:hypothetical protein